MELFTYYNDYYILNKLCIYIVNIPISENETQHKSAYENMLFIFNNTGNLLYLSRYLITA